jgi:hypothetical protein
MNEAVIWKWKSPTEARKDITIDKDVAKPFMMLSAYLITRAVMRPPRTWVSTVAQAHGVKLANRCVSEGTLCGEVPEECEGAMIMGTSAGSSEKRESCTLRTQRSAVEFLITISKYTPARPDVKQAAATARKPLKGIIVCTSADDPSLDVFLLTLDWIWTMPTPIARKKRANHLRGDSLRRRRRTEKAAVVRIFIW